MIYLIISLSLGRERLKYVTSIKTKFIFKIRKLELFKIKKLEWFVTVV